MLARAVGAFGVVFGKASKNVRRDENTNMNQNGGNIPLMVAVVAHEMYAWEIQLSSTCRASCNMEHTRMFGI